MLCKCGCGRETKSGNEYINHHNRKDKKFSKKRHFKRLCVCGCGEYAPIDKHWIWGHNARSDKTKTQLASIWKGKKRKLAEETKAKLAEFAKSQWADEEQRKKKIKGLRNTASTPESKEKKRIAQKKKWEDPELSSKMKKRMKGTKLGVSPWIKGKNHTEESKQKMSDSLKGRETWNKGQICPQLSGPNNGSWAGGIKNFPYCFSWDEITKAIKEKYNHECQNPFCEGKGSIIVTHHINYNKQDCDGKNLIALCNSCNSKANKNREFHQQFYSEIRKIRDENRYHDR